MKAIVYERYGPPDVLTVREVDKPAPKPGELLIRVHAVEVTKADCELRSFHFPVKWFWLPLRLALGVTGPRRTILGGYFAGTVEQVGADAKGFAVGDAIFGSAQLRMGAYGEYVCLPADYALAPTPGNVSFEAAASTLLGGFNAVHFMKLADVHQGDHVLINGAGGSIGLIAIQIAKARGATVTAVDAPHKAAIIQQAGADRFVDYTTEDFSIRDDRYEVVFDIVASSSFSKCIRVVKAGGIYMTANPSLAKMLRCAITTLCTGKRASFAFASESRADLIALRDMIESGEVTPIVGSVYPRERIVDAHREVESERRVGSVVLSHAVDESHDA